MNVFVEEKEKEREFEKGAEGGGGRVIAAEN